jgi:hypothetical protein
MVGTKGVESLKVVVEEEITVAQVRLEIRRRHAIELGAGRLAKENSSRFAPSSEAGHRKMARANAFIPQILFRRK